jgi:predicted amidophosphoribosyltransferase
MVAAHTAGHTIIRQALDGLLDLLYPPRCVACGAWGAWLCARCLTQLPPGGQAAGTLGYCTSILWVAAHTHPLRPAVHALKYSGVTALVEPLSELLAGRWLRASAARTTCTPIVAPVPLHPAREKERGYNQSVLLATATARRLGLPWRTRAVEAPSRHGVAGGPETRANAGSTCGGPWRGAGPAWRRQFFWWTT